MILSFFIGLSNYIEKYKELQSEFKLKQKNCQHIFGKPFEQTRKIGADYHGKTVCESTETVIARVCKNCGYREEKDVREIQWENEMRESEVLRQQGIKHYNEILKDFNYENS